MVESDNRDRIAWFRLEDLKHRPSAVRFISSALRHLYMIYHQTTCQRLPAMMHCQLPTIASMRSIVAAAETAAAADRAHDGERVGTSRICVADPSRAGAETISYFNDKRGAPSEPILSDRVDELGQAAREAETRRARAKGYPALRRRQPVEGPHHSVPPPPTTPPVRSPCAPEARRASPRRIACRSRRRVVAER